MMKVNAEKRVGELLFGRALRFRVAAWILRRPDPLFYQEEASRGVRYSASGVAQELSRLVELGMLSRLPRSGGERRQYYSRTDSPLWTIIGAALDALILQQGTRPPRRRAAVKAP